MLDLTHLGQPLKNQQIIYANSNADGVNWTVWQKPRNVNFLNVFLLGGGGGGGAGAAAGTVNNSNGGGGGGSGAQYNATFNCAMLPDILHISVGSGGNGGNANTTAGNGISSYIGIYPTVITINTLLGIANGGLGGADAGGTSDPLASSSFGLATKFFNGSWRSTISTGDIGTLPLTTANESSNVSLAGGVNIWTSINYTSVGDNYGFIAIGYFKPPTSGTYYFQTTSDDSSGVWLGDIAVAASGRTTANATVNNNLGVGQGATTVSSTGISLSSGSWYAIRIVHEEGTGGDSLQFRWSSDGTNWSTDLSQYFKTPPISSGSYNYTSTSSGVLDGSTGGGGLGGNSSAITNLSLFGLAISTNHVINFGGQTGTAGGSSILAAGALTLPTSGLVVTGGTGGAGIGSGAGNAGGSFVVPANTVFPTHTGGVAGTSSGNGGNGSNGYQPIPKLLYFYGGTGGGSGGTAAVTNGGTGGSGSYGCGGGGGGGCAGVGATRGNGGRGGDGICILTYW